MNICRKHGSPLKGNLHVRQMPSKIADRCDLKLEFWRETTFSSSFKMCMFESTNFVIVYRVTSSRKLSSGLDNARLGYLVLIWLVSLVQFILI